MTTIKQERLLGLQLYSLQELLSQNVHETLKKVSKVDFKEIETYGYNIENGFFGTSVQEFNLLLDDTGLITPSGHYDLDSYLRDGTKETLEPILEVAKKLNQKYVVIPSIDLTLRKSIEDYKILAEKFNRAGELCNTYDLNLAYHNHDFEFINYASESGYDILLKEIDKDLVNFEMDIYWVIRAGIDPTSLLQKYPDRFPLLHLKDMNPDNLNLNIEIGSGCIDYTYILRNLVDDNVKHIIIEQENFTGDPYQSLSESCSYIKKYYPEISINKNKRT